MDLARRENNFMVSDLLSYVRAVSKILKAPTNEAPKIWIILSGLCTIAAPLVLSGEELEQGRAQGRDELSSEIR